MFRWPVPGGRVRVPSREAPLSPGHACTSFGSGTISFVWAHTQIIPLASHPHPGGATVPIANCSHQGPGKMKNGDRQAETGSSESGSCQDSFKSLAGADRRNGYSHLTLLSSLIGPTLRLLPMAPLLSPPPSATHPSRKKERKKKQPPPLTPPQSKTHTHT